MAGIAGVISGRLHEEHQAALDAMIKCMLHEPFYTSGTYASDHLGLWAGWVCHEGSFSDCMPVWNENRDICLIFSGENYADPADLVDLRTRGHSFDPENASYLVHLYEEIGTKCLEKFNGWFSGVLVDLRKETIIVFNDRYGLNRIYYHENAYGFYFSSEAKSLLKVLPETRRLDFASLGEFFSCGCVLQNRSLFSGVSLLPGGSMWLFSSRDQVKKGTYFSKNDFETQPRLTGKEYYDTLKETFPRVLKRYLNGGKKIGISLTGGVDSRMVMAWAQCSPNSLPCYTFGGKYRDSVDVKLAREVAKICQQPHQVIHVGRKFLDEFPSLAEKTVHLTDGAMDVSGSVDLFVNRLARQIAPIRLTGNYGGEILRELIAFKPVRLHEELFDKEFARHIQTAAETYASERKDRPLSFVAFKQVPWHHYSRLSLERSQIAMRSPYLDNDIVRLAYQTPSELASSNEPSLRMIADGNAVLGRIGTDRGVLPTPIPIFTTLQHLYQELTFKAEYAFDYGMPQWFAKIDFLFSPLHLERLFLGRHKFHHFRIWYRNELSHYLKDILLDSRTTNRPYLRGVNLEEMVKSHIKGIRNFTLEFHRILTSELLQRQLIERT